MSSNYKYISTNIIGKVKSVDNEKTLNEILNRIHSFQNKLPLSEINKLRKLILNKITTSNLKILVDKRFKSFINEKLKVIKQHKELNERRKKEKEIEEKRKEFAKLSTKVLREANEKIDDQESTDRIIKEKEEDSLREKKKREQGTNIYQETTIHSTTWINKDQLTPPPTEE